MLASSLIACNLGCNPRRENKVLATHLVIDRRVPFQPLVQMSCNVVVTNV
jgi:hypothetical protein